ncbi:hypothetical protein PIB30_091300 [Stylosanthes scabra]|uniref:Putative plant transposon protein domain-containing protein n=1 Tax=Stylosanthes scabra TaxID=79078 RepID=A0ABU6WUH5_9FABA|nr:hypothetical protein [Stylosanthes scabra]
MGSITEQIAKRGWKRLCNPKTEISSLLIQEFFANAVQIEGEKVDQYPYQSYVKGVEIDFSAAKIKEILKLRSHTPDTRTNYENRLEGDQKLDEVIRTLCVPTAIWKLSANNRKPTQLKRHDLLPLATGWHEFIVHSIILTGNKSEITVVRALLIHSIITGDYVRAEELIVDNLAIIAESMEGRNNLIFPSTIYRLCKQ